MGSGNPRLICPILSIGYRNRSREERFKPPVNILRIEHYVVDQVRLPCPVIDHQAQNDLVSPRS